METTVNERLKLLRNQMNLTIDELASKCNVNKTTIWRIENSHGDAMPKTLKLIASALNVNKDWLINGKGQMFLDKPKEESVNPYRDALVTQLNEQNVFLQKEIEWLRGIVNQLTAGKPNFRKAYLNAGLLFPNKKQEGLSKHANA
jgi:transcriptional regulator with XRE-family HTH domain